MTDDASQRGDLLCEDLPHRVTIRLATPDDAEIIAHHRRAMFDDIRGPFDPADVAAMNETYLPFLRRGLADGSYRGWLACTPDGEVVAGGGVYVYWWPTSPDCHDPRRAYVIDIYTAPAYRRQGLARRVMAVIVDWCRAEGFKSVSLHASPYGRSLYESLGFQPTNEMRLYF